jgi:hypothetical protein
LGARIKGQQPEARFNQLQETLISEMASLHGLK